jgi:hypothetical protein
MNTRRRDAKAQSKTEIKRLIFLNADLCAFAPLRQKLI